MTAMLFSLTQSFTQIFTISSTAGGSGIHRPVEKTKKDSVEIGKEYKSKVRFGSSFFATYFFFSFLLFSFLFCIFVVFV